MSLYTSAHLSFIEATVQFIGGNIEFAEPTPQCNIDEITACTSKNDLGCLNLDDVDSECCNSSSEAITCLKPLYESCSRKVLNDALEGVEKLHNDKCNPVTCFAASASLQLENGVVKKMEDIQVGDRVKVDVDTFSDVFAFSHLVKNDVSSFVRIEAGEHAIELTAGHYLPLNGRLTVAGQAKLGDVLLLGNGTNAPIDEIRLVKRRGLYSPQTLHGNIVIDGIVASTHTKWFHPYLADALLMPIRALYRLGWTDPLGNMLHKTVPASLQRLIPQGSLHF